MEKEQDQRGKKPEAPKKTKGKTGEVGRREYPNQDLQARRRLDFFHTDFRSTSQCAKHFQIRCDLADHVYWTIRICRTVEDAQRRTHRPIRHGTNFNLWPGFFRTLPDGCFEVNFLLPLCSAAFKREGLRELVNSHGALKPNQLPLGFAMALSDHPNPISCNIGFWSLLLVLFYRLCV